MRNGQMEGLRQTVRMRPIMEFDLWTEMYSPTAKNEHKVSIMMCILGATTIVFELAGLS